MRSPSGSARPVRRPAILDTFLGGRYEDKFARQPFLATTGQARGRLLLICRGRGGGTPRWHDGRSDSRHTVRSRAQSWRMWGQAGADVMQQRAILLRPFHATCWRSSRVEHLICNQAVVGSIPIASFEDVSCGGRSTPSGEVPEWPKGADCKSAGVSLRRFESSPLHHPTRCRSEHRVQPTDAGIAQLVRASAFQAEGRGFESRLPL